VRFFWAPTHRRRSAISRRLEPRAADRPFRALLLGLGVLDFMKTHVDPQMRARSVAGTRPAAIALGEAEGLDAHARSVMMRLNRDDPPGARVPRKKAASSRSRSTRRPSALQSRRRDERKVAIYDLLEDNTFAPTTMRTDVCVAFEYYRSAPRIRYRRESGAPVVAHLLSLSPLRRIVKDYYTVCDSYYAAIRTATPDRIEALDMGRRPPRRRLQDLDGAAGAQVRLDFDTARRLFTLICVLHWKG